HDNLKEDGPLGGAVNPRRLDDGVGDGGAEEGTGNDDVEAGNRQRQDQHPHGISQVQNLGVHHIGCGHAAAEDHGDENQNGQEVIELVLGTGQDVAHNGGKHHADGSTQNRDIHGNPQGLEDGGSLA